MQRFSSHFRYFPVNYLQRWLISFVWVQYIWLSDAFFLLFTHHMTPKRIFNGALWILNREAKRLVSINALALFLVNFWLWLVALC